MAKFTLGRLVATAAVVERMKEDYIFNHFINDSLERFRTCDWGDMNEDDVWTNDQSVEIGEGRLHGVYIEPTTKTVIWIITEWDHSITTILFPSDY